jgi:hypothetical protein
MSGGSNSTLYIHCQQYGVLVFACVILHDRGQMICMHRIQLPCYSMSVYVGTETLASGKDILWLLLPAAVN